MMYIFEGVDHCGKDTLIHALNTMFPLHFGAPIFDGLNVYDPIKKELKEHIKDPAEWQKAVGYEVANFIAQTNHNVFVNRYNWSELVYGDVLRDGADWDFYWDIMEPLLAPISLVIYVDANPDDIRERILRSKRNKSIKLLENIEQLQKGYERIIEHQQTIARRRVMCVKNNNEGYESFRNHDYFKKVVWEIINL